jgi:hypothetical protein
MDHSHKDQVSVLSLSALIAAMVAIPSDQVKIIQFYPLYHSNGRSSNSGAVPNNGQDECSEKNVDSRVFDLEFDDHEST